MKYNFKPYLSSIFIESGSYGGDGVKAALSSGFKKVISIELSKEYYELCKSRYPQKNVTFYHGDSIDVLPEILKGIDCKCTFWLDGHFCGGESASGKYPVPLMEELKIIATHHIKNHILLLDDMRLLRNHSAEWKDLTYGIREIEDMIHSINPNYKITYGFGVVKDDILIAQV
jgi:hypothetical protein